MKKNIITPLFATSALLLLAGCGASSDQANTNTSESQASSPSSTSAAANTASTAWETGHGKPAPGSLLATDSSYTNGFMESASDWTMVSDGDVVYSYYDQDDPSSVHNNAIAVIFPSAQKCEKSSRQSLDSTASDYISVYKSLFPGINPGDQNAKKMDMAFTGDTPTSTTAPVQTQNVYAPADPHNAGDFMEFNMNTTKTDDGVYKTVNCSLVVGRRGLSAVNNTKWDEALIEARKLGQTITATPKS